MVPPDLLVEKFQTLVSEGDYDLETVLATREKMANC